MIYKPPLAVSTPSQDVNIRHLNCRTILKTISTKSEATKQKEQHDACQGISPTVTPKEPLVLYVEKGDISYSTLYFSDPNDERLEYPTLREYLEDIAYGDDGEYD